MDDQFVASVLAHRRFVTDTTVLDCLELQKAYGHRLPVTVTAEELQERWCVGYESASRRMTQLKAKGLCRYDRGVRGAVGYLIWGIGPQTQL